MEPTRLTEHKFVKGKFVTPFGEFFSKHGKFRSWSYQALPEYLWLGLLLKHTGRTEAILRCIELFKNMINIMPNFELPMFSRILSSEEDTQKLIYELIANSFDKYCLTPLTVIFPWTKAHSLNNVFHHEGQLIGDKIRTLMEILNEGFMHQSYFATDLRFLSIVPLLLKNSLHFVNTPVTRELISQYPYMNHDSEMMKMARPTVRSLEISIFPQEYEKNDTRYTVNFWASICELTDCRPFIFKYEETTINMDTYRNSLIEFSRYMDDLYCSLLPVDRKAIVLLGLTNYASRQLMELLDHSLSNTIAGRGIVRNLVETYIMIKYLLNIEPNHADVWSDFQNYGFARLKFISEKYIERGVEYPSSHVPYKAFAILSQENQDHEFIEIDTSYFDKKSIREKAIEVGCKDLYDLYYEHDSTFTHSLWGAVIQSALMKCDNPGHLNHWVLDTHNEVSLPSVTNDCRMVFDLIIKTIDEMYGVPESIMKTFKYG